MRITTKENDIESILYSEKQIAAMVETLGETLTRDYAGSRPVMVCVLKGASIFFTDLCREMDCNIDMDFITVSSYGVSSKSSGVVKLTKDIDVDITGREVIVEDDIIDSGLTLKHPKALFSTRGPKSVKTIALRKTPYTIKNNQNTQDYNYDTHLHFLTVTMMNDALIILDGATPN